MLNTYGLKMTGIRKASGATCNWDGRTQISYDTETGEIYTNDHIGDSWSQYHSPAVITVCFASEHMTMQEIADRIREAVEDKARWEAYEGSAC